ncbi:MAG: DUF255 domain-containing protein [Bacteroidales bacterium]
MMKKGIYLLLAGLLVWTSAQAQDQIKWYSIEEAIQMAGKEPRVMVIDVYTDWCGWCKRMDATTFKDPSIVSLMNEKFYPVKLNAEGKEDIVIGDHTYKFVDNGSRATHEMAAVVTQGRLSYPTISYIDGRGRILQIAPGYKTVDQLKIHLDYFNEGAYTSEDFETFKAAREGQPAAPSVIQNL